MSRSTPRALRALLIPTFASADISISFSSHAKIRLRISSTQNPTVWVYVSSPTVAGDLPRQTSLTTIVLQKLLNSLFPSRKKIQGFYPNQFNLLLKKDLEK